MLVNRNVFQARRGEGDPVQSLQRGRGRRSANSASNLLHLAPWLVGSSRPTRPESAKARSEAKTWRRSPFAVVVAGEEVSVAERQTAKARLGQGMGYRKKEPEGEKRLAITFDILTSDGSIVPRSLTLSARGRILCTRR